MKYVLRHDYIEPHVVIVRGKDFVGGYLKCPVCLWTDPAEQYSVMATHEDARDRRERAAIETIQRLREEEHSELEELREYKACIEAAFTGRMSRQMMKRWVTMRGGPRKETVIPSKVIPILSKGYVSLHRRSRGSRSN